MFVKPIVVCLDWVRVFVFCFHYSIRFLFCVFFFSCRRRCMIAIFSGGGAVSIVRLNGVLACSCFRACVESSLPHEVTKVHDKIGNDH